MIYSLLRNYLRVRGEYGANLSQYTDAMELPPRARRIHNLRISPIRINGTTSACAENTLRLLMMPSVSRNYLRVRGEYQTTSL